MGKGILFIFSGLPAVGKSTLAKYVVKEFGAVYLRIDTIEQGLKDLCRINVGGGKAIGWHIVWQPTICNWATMSWLIVATLLN